jgi:ketosteroid isomerase-like protein
MSREDVEMVRRVYDAWGRGDWDAVFLPNGHLWSFRDGRILSMKSFPDPEDALQAAGSGE